MRDVTLERIKQQVDILDLISRLGLEYRYMSGRYYILCPLHNDHNIGSCAIFPENNSFYCYSCKKRGDGVDIVKGALNLRSLREAKDWICRQYNIEQDNSRPNNAAPIFLVDRKACETIGLQYGDDVYGICAGPFADEADATICYHELREKDPRGRYRISECGDELVVERFLHRVTLLDFEDNPEGLQQLVLQQGEETYARYHDLKETLDRVVGDPSSNPALYNAVAKQMDNVQAAVRNLVSDKDKFEAWSSSLPSKMVKRSLVSKIKEDLRAYAF